MIEKLFKNFNHTISNGNVTFYFNGDSHTIYDYKNTPIDFIEFTLRQITKWSKSNNFLKSH